MTFHKKDPNKPTPPPARVYRYGLPFGPEGEEGKKRVRGQMLRAHEYQQELARIMQAGRERYRQILSAVPEVAVLQAQAAAQQAEIERLYTIIRARRAEARSKKVQAPEMVRIDELKAALQVSYDGCSRATKAALGSTTADVWKSCAKSKKLNQAFERVDGSTAMVCAATYVALGGEIEDEIEIDHSDLLGIDLVRLPVADAQQVLHDLGLSEPPTGAYDDHPDVVLAISQNNKRCNDEERKARARVARAILEGPDQQPRDALYWSTYNLISASVRQACQTPMGPAVRDYWDGEGRVAVQLQGGLTVKELLAGTDTQLRIEQAPRVRKSGRKSPRCAHGAELFGQDGLSTTPSCGCKSRSTQTMLRIRVGSDRRKPVWVSFAVVYLNEKNAGDVRPLPENGIVKSAVVTKRRVGTREHWELHLTVIDEENRPPAVRELGVHAALDIGWRARLPGLRVFYLAGTDGERRELICPNDIESGFDKADELRGVRDKLFNVAREQLGGYLKSGAAPTWLKEATQTMPHWRSVARLSKLVSSWRDRRFDGDVEIFREMFAWWQKNRHLYQWESSQRLKTKNRRNKLYRILAKEIVLKYASITLEELDLRPLLERAEPGEEELHAAARRNRFVAAPGVFREYVLHAAQKHGTAIVKKPAAYTTITCSTCGEIEKFDKRKLHHTCKNGHRWDQDENASLNLLGASGEAAE
jgi:hypothetical protein